MVLAKVRGGLAGEPVECWETPAGSLQPPRKATAPVQVAGELPFPLVGPCPLEQSPLGDTPPRSFPVCLQSRCGVSGFPFLGVGQGDDVSLLRTWTQPPQTALFSGKPPELWPAQRAHQLVPLPSPAFSAHVGGERPAGSIAESWGLLRTREAEVL